MKSDVKLKLLHEVKDKLRIFYEPNIHPKNLKSFMIKLKYL